jgi:hypothetical protein
MVTCATIGRSFGAGGVPIVLRARNVEGGPFGRIDVVGGGAGA